VSPVPSRLLIGRSTRVTVGSRSGGGKSQADSQSISSWLRQFHDKLGFKAKGTLVNGGLCSGAMFRTEEFIEVDTHARVGSKENQSVHIEHTVPICVLRSELAKRLFSNQTEALAWVLRHSVTTGFYENQKGHLKGVGRVSDAFSDGADGHLRPFMRYKRMFDADEPVWNVFKRQLVEPRSFTFDDHFALLLRLLCEAGAEKQMLCSLERHA
jgi:hypothetical protein